MSSSSSCIASVQVDGSSTVTVTDTGTGTACQGATSTVLLPPLPEIIRHDKAAYFEQRMGLPPLEDGHTSHLLHDHDNDANANANDDATPNPTATPTSSISSPQCRLYMAKSSIPGAGLGVFSGTHIPPESYVDLNPQILLPLIDIRKNKPTMYNNSILHNYPWQGTAMGTHLEAGHDAHFAFPNLGMLCNSHLGLRNVHQMEKVAQVYSRVGDRRTQPGSGASSYFDGISFQTYGGDGDGDGGGIDAGEEIFLDYGVSYFHHREKSWGVLFPTEENYEAADKLLSKFEDEEDITSEQGQEMWGNILESLERGEYDLMDDGDSNNNNNNSKDDPEERIKVQQRIASALPKSIADIPHALKVGTARYSVPGSKVSLDYLKTNGMCLDNLRRGKSSISQGGHGAFATVDLSAGSVIVPSPLIPIKRDLLHMHTNIPTHMREDGQGTVRQTEQLFLNYCFGHPKSSLLLFPYGPSVQYINHDSVSPNAYIRWSNDIDQEHFFKEGVNDVPAGIVLEFVALRDIAIGEEITIDYGNEWTTAWHDHLQSWDIDDDSSAINPQNFIETFMNDDDEHKKKPMRTMKEQEEHPYPKCVRTACYSHQSRSGIWKFRPFRYDHMRFCDIIERTYKEGNYWYTVKVHETEFDEGNFDADNNELKYVPQEAMFFAQDEYCGDIHLPNAFRHEIGVPENFYPEKWLDLVAAVGGEDINESDGIEGSTNNNNGINQDDDDYEDEDKDGDSGETTTVKCGTTVGQFSMIFHKSWSPIGYDRAVELFQRGFYDNSHFFRVIPGFLTQFGMSYTQDTDLKDFAKTPIPDDPQLNPKIPFVEGTISFAGSGPNSRTSHLFISDTRTNDYFGTMLWETPVGSLVSDDDLQVVRKLNADYGDRPIQHHITVYGRKYIETEFPKLDEFLTCEIIRNE